MRAELAAPIDGCLTEVFEQLLQFLARSVTDEFEHCSEPASCGWIVHLFQVFDQAFFIEVPEGETSLPRFEHDP